MTTDLHETQSPISICAICQKREYLIRLHGDKGGPRCCFLCAGAWHAKHGKRRILGRVAIRAMSAFLDAGGSVEDLDKLKLSALGLDVCGFDDLIDPLGYMAGVTKSDSGEIILTTELLDGAIKLAHPDMHPPERAEMATRVSAELRALKPFTFPASKPKAVPDPSSPPKPTPKKPKDQTAPQQYPCAECKDTVPYYYCDICGAEYDARHKSELAAEAAKRRKARERRKARRPATSSAWRCGTAFKGKRTDARFCSDLCRQRAHRVVTDRSGLSSEPAVYP